MFWFWTNRRENELFAKLNSIEERLKKMSKEIDALTAQVKANNDVIDSAVTLIKSLAQQFADAKTDPAKIQALSDEIKAKAGVLSEAVVANTPVATAPPVVEPPVEPPVDPQSRRR